MCWVTKTLRNLAYQKFPKCFFMYKECISYTYDELRPVPSNGKFLQVSRRNKTSYAKKYYFLTVINKCIDELSVSNQ